MAGHEPVVRRHVGWRVGVRGRLVSARGAAGAVDDGDGTGGGDRVGMVCCCRFGDDVEARLLRLCGMDGGDVGDGGGVFDAIGGSVSVVMWVGSC